MTYLMEFKSRISSRDVGRVLSLWKEFCEMETVEEEELLPILEVLRDSDMSPKLGPYIELCLPLIFKLPLSKSQINALSLLYDIQTTNSQELWDLLHKLLKEEFGADTLFSEKMRITGLRTKGNFQGALSHFLLLNHLQKGNFVFHKGGWGVGEITDCSFLREQITVQFENVASSKKDLPFKTAFKSLTRLPSDHFLALRFGSPDRLEKEAQENPIDFMKKILVELGPKTASEIKDLVSGFVIDDSSYSKWWQQTRAKLKKDPLIVSPENIKEPFVLRKQKLTLSSRVDEIEQSATTTVSIICALWSLMRDFPQVLKDSGEQQKIISYIDRFLSLSSLSHCEKIQLLCLREFAGQPKQKELKEIITSLENPINEAVKIETIGLRKRMLQAIREHRNDWETIFRMALLELEPIQIKEYAYKELVDNNRLDLLEQVFESILEHPLLYSDAFMWAFDKSVEKESDVLTSEKDLERFFESFLLLLAAVENKPNRRDLAKKMYVRLTGHRFKIVRDLFKYADLAFIKEFLLLASKCQSIKEHDLKILQSLAEVAHPELLEKERVQVEEDILWTTEAGYRTAQERIKHIGTVEIVDNAKEIEAARALGDLRENAEYKFALERRSRLQAELKLLSDQFHRARIITKEDVIPSQVGIGTKVLLKDTKGTCQEYLILGPWDANVEKNILSFQSKFAEAMIGKKAGDTFSFREDTFLIEKITSHF